MEQNINLDLYQKAYEYMVTDKNIKFFNIGNSEIYLHSRPTKEHFKIWKENFQINVIINLEANEKCQQTEDQAKQYQIEYINLPLPAAKYFNPDQVNENLRSKLPHIINLIQKKNKVLIHCHAGKHRTGFFAYTLLRIFRNSDEDASQILKQTRIEAYEGLNDQSCGNGKEYSKYRINSLNTSILLYFTLKK